MLIGGILFSNIDRYVAANGSDSNSGSIFAPWLTIAKVNASNTAGKTIHFRGGDTFGDTALALRSTTDYDSYGTGRAVISGGQAVTAWTQVDAPNNIWRATWNAGRPRQLYVNGTRVIRARTTSGIPGSPSTTSTGYASTGGFLNTYGNQTDIELVWRVEWHNEYCPVASVTSSTITMLPAGFTPIKALLTFNGYTTLPDFIENAYEIFTANHAAGTFYQDRTAGFVYLIPPVGVSDPNAATVIAPVLDRIVTGTSVSNVAISNIEFAHTTNLDVNTAGFPEMQANMVTLSDVPNLSDWRKSQASIRLTNCTNVTLTRCKLTRFGTVGLDFDGTCTDCGAYGNIIYDVSGNGIQVGGPGQYGGAQPVRTTLSNNYVSRCGQEFLGSVGFMQWWASYSNWTHNEIKNLPYSGMSMGLGWGAETLPNGATNNEVQYNRVDTVMQTMNDGGCFYANSHNLLSTAHHNYLSNAGPASYVGPNGANQNGIYTDNSSKGWVISNNVVGGNFNKSFFANDNTGPNTFSTNTASGGSYVESPGPDTVVPNTYDTLLVLTAEATALAGLALNAGLEVAYADVKSEGDLLP